MSDLIEALQIFLKYGNPQFPTSCQHDKLVICGIAPKDVSDEDKEKLKKLGFFVSKSGKCFKSLRFGSD